MKRKIFEILSKNKNGAYAKEKVCTECGCYHDDLKLSDRIFKCDCGVEMDRDIHAAQNMVWFYENNVGTLCHNVGVGHRSQACGDARQDFERYKAFKAISIVESRRFHHLWLS